MSRLAVNQHPVLSPDWQQPFHDPTLLCRGLKVRRTFYPLLSRGETTDSSAIMIIVARAHSCYFVISVDGRRGGGCREEDRKDRH